MRPVLWNKKYFTITTYQIIKNLTIKEKPD